MHAMRVMEDEKALLELDEHGREGIDRGLAL